MSLFDPNTVAIVDPIPEQSGITTAPEDTGKAMHPHDPANSVDSKDDIINFDKVLEAHEDPGEAVGSTNIFEYNKATSTVAVEDQVPEVKPLSAEAAFTNFFLGIESGLVVHETGVNPEITPSDVNPQMAVFPLDDPAITKTSDDIKDVNGAYLENEIKQNDELVPFDASNAVHLVNNIRAISQESLLPIHSEDGVTYADIVQDEHYVDTYTEALIDAEEKISVIREQIEETGGIDKATAIALESIQPGILSNHVSIESFTSYPTKTNLLVSLESTDNWVTGAKVLGGAVIFGLIVKMLLWIRDKLGGAVNISDKEISAAKAKRDDIIKGINDIARDNLDVIRTNPEIVKRINARATALLGKEYKVKIENIAEANNVFLQQYTHAEFKNYNKLQAIIIVNKNINSGMETMSKFLLEKLKEIEANFINYEAKFRSTDIMDPTKFSTDWSTPEGILKTLGFEHKPQNKMKIGEYMRGVISTLSKTKNAIPTYGALSTNSYSPDSSTGLDDVQKSINTLLKRVSKLAEDHTTFPDKNIGHNRNEIGTILKDEVNNLLGISLSAIAIRNSGNSIALKLVNVVKKTDATWKEVFKGSPISYGK